MYYVPGKLRCYGRAEQSPDLLSTCSSLKKSGVTTNGFYLTKVEQTAEFKTLQLFQDSLDDNIHMNFCKMSNSGYKEEELRMEGHTGRMVEEFTILNWGSETKRVNAKNVNGYPNQHVFDAYSNVSLSPSSTDSFDFDGSHLIAKKSGVFGIWGTFSTTYTYLYIDQDRIYPSESPLEWHDTTNFASRRNFVTVKLDKDEKIWIRKVRTTNEEGRKIIIKEL